MKAPANDIYPQDATSSMPPSASPGAPIGGPAKALSIILFLVQCVQIIALIFLIAVAALSVFGPLDGEAMQAASLSPGGHQALILYALGSLIVMIAVVWQLRKLVTTLRLGDPFAEDNVKRLRYIWIILAIGEAARTVIHPFIARVETGEALTIDIRPHVWFFILILIVLAQVFKEGARMRAEAELTV